MMQALRLAFPKVSLVGISRREIDLTSPSAVQRKLLPLLSSRTALVFCAGKLKGEGDNVELLQNNLAIACNVTDALHERPVKQVLVVSSAAIYGEDVPNGSITEQTPAHPTSYYGMSKFLTEWLFARSTPSERLLLIRPPFVYGPADRSSSSPAGFLRTVSARQPITLWGNGTEKREFLFVEDLATIAVQLMRRHTSGVVNVTPGHPYSLREAILVSQRLTGVRIPIRSRRRTKRKVDHLFGRGRLRRILPKYRFTLLEEGLGACLRAWSRPKRRK